MIEEYSVLMSVYEKEKPDYLRQSIDSILNQTKKTNDFVIVCDGPLTDCLYALLREYDTEYPGLFQIIYLPENRGVGSAVKVGIEYCKNELVAKMDSDDISIPERCELQLERFNEKPELAVCGGYILEFGSTPDNPISRRLVPCSNDDIRKYARRRQPFNNPSVMYRKSAIMNVGGFKPYARGEDYDLYIRLLANGYCGENIAKDLVMVRIAEGSSDRRVSRATYKGFIKTRRNALKIGFSGLWDFIIACMAETVLYISPVKIQNTVYHRLLHKPVYYQKKDEDGNETPQKNIILPMLQQSLLEMLREIDRICKLHSIPYMLFAGSALGAVRHGGFIPWDDDLDIVMLREDYDRFLSAAEDEIDKDKFFLQKEFSEHWPMFFSKLRKNSTTCIERYIPRDAQVHQGIYIDIFPCDNLAKGRFVQKLQFYASKIVIAKSLDKRGYITDSKSKKMFILLCRLLPSAPFRRIAQRRKDIASEMVHTFFGASSSFEKSTYPREWFTQTEYMRFENGDFPVSAHSHELLTVLYGDYMTPTPESERGKKIHAEIVDLHKSYKEYESIQKNMDFKEYTRSIR